MIYLQHPLAALLVQFFIARAFSSWWAGAGIASAYFVGREIAQAEYRWIEHFSGGLRANMPWWGPFDPRVWTTLDQWVDWAGPLVVTFAMAWFVMRGRKRGRLL